jgi:hypothetical protein
LGSWEELIDIGVFRKVGICYELGRSAEDALDVGVGKGFLNELVSL